MDVTITDMIPPSAIADGSPNVVMTTSSPAIGDTSSASSGEWDMWTIIRYAAIILILAFLGFNLFTYLGEMTGGMVTALGPAVGGAAKATGDTTKQVVNTAAIGAESIVDIAAGSVTSGINLLEKGLEGGAMKQLPPSKSPNVGSALTRAEQEQEPQPDDAGSKTQLSNPSGKAGFCYIGEDRGYRSCLRVGEGDNCMSGEIFPSRDICVNPQLRQG